MVKSKKITVFETDDGKQFFNKPDAFAHEADHKLLALAHKHLSGGEIWPDMVKDFIIDKWDEIKEIMEGN